MFAVGRRLNLGILAGIALLVSLPSAEAHQRSHHRHPDARRLVYAAIFAVEPVIQCVAFAKQDAGIDISGNARDWWSNAAGVYQRGSQPETGSVLSFQENERMPLGHVAVVSGIENSRTIVIDQSHWNSRGVTRGVVVEDVSDNNDWSAVRVQLGRGEGFGSIYPTHGFIYPRPDTATLSNADRRAAPIVSAALSRRRLNRAGHIHAITEIAEAPYTSQAIDVRINGISEDTLHRRLR